MKWIRWILISLLVLLAFLIGVHDLTSINQDIGRHITIGKIIWETKSIPTTNLFSYTFSEFPFVNHHWLGGLFLFAGERVWGLDGWILIKALIIAVAFALSFFAFYRKDNYLISVILGLISVFILLERTDLRPEIFSFLFLSTYLFILFRKTEGKWLWLLPIVQLVWVNTHIYFFLGPLTYSLYLVGKMFNEKVSKNDWLVGLGVLIATLLNPSGIYGALYPLFIFNNYGYSIVENKSPFFLRSYGGYSQLTFHALLRGITILAASFLANYKNFKKNLFEAGLSVLVTVLSLDMVRNFPIFGLAMIPIGAKNFFESGFSLKSKRVAISLTIIIIAISYSLITNQIYIQADLAERFGLVVPEGAQKAVNFVKENNLKGPIFNNFDIGSFLIWKLPKEKVFIDGRPEAYPANFIQNVYIPMQESEEEWKKYSEQYGIRLVFWNYRDITPWSQKFVGRILSDKNWNLMYKDDDIIILTFND
jgi:hypothetical protein